jgi:cation diffusion facilitator family transporter
MSDDSEHSTKHIVQSLTVNLLIAVMKAVAAFFTKSGAMLAEALHSLADCGNQILLLVGVRQARRPPDATHPLGYGRALYFWSFMVALLLFSGGGVFSIYEGIHKIHEPEPVEKVWLGFLILGGSIVLEGGATISNIHELNKRRGKTPFMRYLRETKDSDLVVVFGENSAAVLGLAFAMGALLLAWATNDGRWDGLGSIVIGLVLIAVALFLAKEVQSLLLGEAADAEIAEAARQAVEETPELTQVLNLITLQQGPGEVMVAIKVAFHPAIDIEEACEVINRFEARLREKRKEIRWCFVEPDVPRTASKRAAQEKLASKPKQLAAD